MTKHVLTPLVDRLLANGVAQPNGCFVWTGAVDKDGYGRMRRGRRDEGMVYTHRASYETFIGPVPDGLLVLHRCDNPPCINPAHFFVGTQGDNRSDCAAKGRNATGDRSGPRLHPERLARGERNASAKLTASAVLEIRRQIAAGATQQVTADAFGVSESAIGYIARRVHWAHV